MAKPKLPPKQSLKQAIASGKVSSKSDRLAGAVQTKNSKATDRQLKNAAFSEYAKYEEMLHSKMQASFNYSNNKAIVQAATKNIRQKDLQGKDIATIFGVEFKNLLKNLGLLAAKAYLISLRNNIRTNRFEYEVPESGIARREAQGLNPPHVALLREEFYIDNMVVDKRTNVVNMTNQLHPRTKINYQTLAKILEYGSAYNKAYPHWRPTFDEIKPKLEKKLKDQVNAFLRNSFGISMISGSRIPIKTELTARRTDITLQKEQSKKRAEASKKKKESEFAKNMEDLSSEFNKQSSQYGEYYTTEEYKRWVENLGKPLDDDAVPF
jgi:hypothetical protein